VATCKYRVRRDEKICAGDLDRQIVIQMRSITPPTADGIDYDEAFVVKQSFWAMIETASGETVFDEANVERVVTHKFYIRYLEGLTFESWVLYNGKRYQIVDVQDLGERHQFYRLRCTLRGSESVPVNRN
jgi:SPP1 family predicted phage head-tail adaptor